MKKELENFIFHQIPITVPMKITVKTASLDEVVIAAPFLPHINHKKSVFGGSLNTISTLSCWSLLHLHLSTFENVETVITESHVKYLHPVTSDFSAICKTPSPFSWERFKKMLTTRGMGRITLTAAIYQGDKLAVDFQGTFAAIKKKSTST